MSETTTKPTPDRPRPLFWCAYLACLWLWWWAFERRLRVLSGPLWVLGVFLERFLRTADGEEGLDYE